MRKGKKKHRVVSSASSSPPSTCSICRKADLSDELRYHPHYHEECSCGNWRFVEMHLFPPEER